MKKILVIDGNSIINRAFYGIRPLTTKSGKHTNAIYGMINIISKQMSALSPDYAAVAFDLKTPTFRHKMYPEYKAGRHPTPEELLSQFDDAKDCLKLMGLHVLELPGYEADDIQGTVAALAHGADNTESYILTGDRDLLQLIDGKITVLLAGNSDTTAMHEAEFTEKYGILPSQFVDMKALMGDSSDNIPGVAGVGEKTAANIYAIGVLCKKIKFNENKKRKNSFEANKKDLIEYFKNENTEKSVVMLFDANFVTLTTLFYKEQSKSTTSCDVAEIVNAIALHKPAYALMAHNHLSGSVEPSEQDDFTTKKLNLICELNGVNFIDHIIVYKDKLFSYRTNGRMEYIKENANLKTLIKQL